jgi:hypothetical protein
LGGNITRMPFSDSLKFNGLGIWIVFEPGVFGRKIRCS